MIKRILFQFLIFLVISIVLLKCSESEEGEKCVDFVHNYVMSKTPIKDENANYPAKVTKFSSTLYNSEGKPACHQKRPTVLMPGWTKLIDGELHVKQDVNLTKDGVVRMTVYGADFDDPLCLNGTSQYLAIPNRFCRFNLCEFIGNDLCEILQKKGVHTIREVEEKLNFNRTLFLPEPPSLLGISLLDLFSGDFNFGFAIESEGRTILELLIPFNHKYLQIGVE
uniref:Uncharacterized protein n=1 Tax=Panagrolaimus sp. JU765 TaxID=591449 RepID=A0AC34Q8E6_9BILA